MQQFNRMNIKLNNKHLSLSLKLDNDGKLTVENEECHTFTSTNYQFVLTTVYTRRTYQERRLGS